MATITTLPAAELGPQHLFLCVEVTMHDVRDSTPEERAAGAGYRADDVVAGQLTGYARHGLMTDVRLHMHDPRWIRIRTDSEVRLLDVPTDQRPIVGFGS